jgi:predicted alpha/beta-hydrolase family hydrolase
MPRRGDALLLTPGAGSDRNQPTLVAVEAALAPMPVARVDFPYRIAGRRAPDRPPVLLDTIRREAAALAARADIAPRRVLLGGRSMGGRMCTLAVAEGLPAAGLVLISYPLRPPGGAQKDRSAHFPSLKVPCLFVHGTRDPFGSPDELEAATATIRGRVTHVWIEGGRHDLKGADAAVAAAVVKWVGRPAPGGRRG